MFLKTNIYQIYALVTIILSENVSHRFLVFGWDYGLGIKKISIQQLVYVWYCVYMYIYSIYIYIYMKKK